MLALIRAASLSLLLGTLSGLAQGPDGYVVSSRGHMDAAILPIKDTVLSTQLWSKWALKNRVGVGQFRMFAVPTIRTSDPAGESDRAELRAAYITKMAGCRMTLQLKDGDDFPLGEVRLNMTNQVDEQGRQASLEGVGSLRMTAAEYRTLVQKGSWTLSWTCPP